VVVEPTHLKNMLVKLDHFPNFRVKNKQIFELPKLSPLACWEEICSRAASCLDKAVPSRFGILKNTAGKNALWDPKLPVPEKSWRIQLEKRNVYFNKETWD